MPVPSSTLTDYARDALHILQRGLALAADGEVAAKALATQMPS